MQCCTARPRAAMQDKMSTGARNEGFLKTVCVDMRPLKLPTGEVSGQKLAKYSGYKASRNSSIKWTTGRLLVTVFLFF